MGCFASGVTVVTTKDNTGKAHGITVTAFSSVSIDPPLILVCIDKKTKSHKAFEESGAFVINILSEDQQDVSNQFASPLPDKFEGIEFERNKNDIPVLSDTLVSLECDLRHSYDGGDHTIFIGEIEKTRVSEGKPLVYCHGDYREIIERDSE